MTKRAKGKKNTKKRREKRKEPEAGRATSRALALVAAPLSLPAPVKTLPSLNYNTESESTSNYSLHLWKKNLFFLFLF